MIILGLDLTFDGTAGNEHYFRDNAAALIVDGAAVSVIEAKKVQKMKRNTDFFSTVRFVLKDYGIRLKHVDKIALFGTGNQLNNRFENHYPGCSPGSGPGLKDYMRRKLQQEFSNDIARGLFFVNPHFAYAMNLFTILGNKKRCLLLTGHETGDEVSVMILKGENTSVDELEVFPGVDREKFPVEKIRQRVIRYGKDSHYSVLCITGNIPLPSCLEQDIRAAGIFPDVLSHPIQHTSGCALGAGLYLYHQQTSTQPRPQVKYETYRNDTERILTQIWQEILSKENPGINDNFFHLGGNSLTALVLINEIHKAFHKQLPLAEVFRYPTIKELSTLINKLPEDKYAAIAPVEKKEYYPLSPAQKRLYTMHQLNKQNTAYNLPAVLTLEGTPDKDAFAGTFNKLVKRQESLRTSFILIGREPMQKVHDKVAFDIDYYDLVTGKPGKIRKLERPGHDPVPGLIKDFIRPFDLSQAPLLRVGMIKIPPGNNNLQYILMVDLHHIISDRVSTGILIKDFMALYEGEELTPLKAQYKDYATWQNRMMGPEAAAKQEKYRKEQFGGNLPVLEMPTDYPRPAVRHFEGSSIGLVIDEELTAALRAAAAKYRATLYIVLLTIVTILLAKYTGQEDIIIGTPAAGRSHADLEGIIGFFINVLPMRGYPKPEITFETFLKQVKNNTIKAFNHQDYPFDQLVEDLGLKRDTSRNPLYDVVFTVLDMELPEIEIPGLRLGPYGMEGYTCKTDLRISATGDGKTIHLQLTYAATLFKKDTAQRMAKRFIQVSQQVMANHRIQIKDITIADEITLIKPGTARQEEEAFDF